MYPVISKHGHQNRPILEVERLWDIFYKRKLGNNAYFFIFVLSRAYDIKLRSVEKETQRRAGQILKFEFKNGYNRFLVGTSAKRDSVQ